MEECKILYLYPDILELYGDFGNIQVLRYRLEQRGINVIIKTYTLGDDVPDFNDYDIVFAGGNIDTQRELLVNDLKKYVENIKEAIQNGVFFLLINSMYQLFGKSYTDNNGNVIPALNIFDYYTETILDSKQNCIGNIILSSNIDGQEINIIGFENHNSQTFNVSTPLGKVILGIGNNFNDATEGFFQKNVIATYLHGPLLAKNPELTDYIIKTCLEKNSRGDIILKPLDDTLERKCKDQLLNRFLQSN